MLMNFKRYVLFTYHGSERISQGMSLVDEDESPVRVSVIPRQLRSQATIEFNFALIFPYYYYYYCY